MPEHYWRTIRLRRTVNFRYKSITPASLKCSLDNSIILVLTLLATDNYLNTIPASFVKNIVSELGEF